MRLTYIYHSGFAIETNNCVIIIDYYRDSDDDKSKGVVHSKLLRQEKPLYILSTHSHYDHFNPEILSWKNTRNDITYIFSNDILENRMATENDAIYLNKTDIFQNGQLWIKAFGSTDLGISFLIKIEDRQIFHAGDLNNWHWDEESTQEEIDKAQTDYLNELHLLANETNHLHLAMFPVDSHLGRNYMLGAEQFTQNIKTDIFSPMHFASEYEKVSAFKLIADKYNTQCVCWKDKGEQIIF